MMEVLLEITRFCEEECDYCSSMATPDGKHRSFNELKEFLDFVNERIKITTINISGGEPLANPEFYNILMYCYKLTEDVWVYTNAIKQVRYNTHIIKEIKVEANACVIPGRQVYISKNHPTRLLPLILQGRAVNFPEPRLFASNGFYRDETHDCSKCNNIVYQADGQVTEAPCKKRYHLPPEEITNSQSITIKIIQEWNIHKTEESKDVK